MADWYPSAYADRIAWHANFAAQAAVNGTTLGLTAGQVTQIGTDAANVALVVNYLTAVSTYSQSVTAWKDIMLDGELNAPLPAAPGVPTPPLFGLGTAASIQARTRQFAGLIKASLAYTPEQGEHYGIVAPASPTPSTPSLVATALTASQVSLAVGKSGFSLVAIDGRVAGGAWSQIGVSMTATYIDSRAPLVAGQPELREYRTQGMVDNARVGALSAIVSAVTVP